MNFMINMAQPTVTIDKKTIEDKFDEIINKPEVSAKENINPFKESKYSNSIIDTILNVVRSYEQSKLDCDLSNVLDITLDEILEDKPLMNKYLDLYLTKDQEYIKHQLQMEKFKPLDKTQLSKLIDHEMNMHTDIEEDTGKSREEIIKTFIYTYETSWNNATISKMFSMYIKSNILSQKTNKEFFDKTKEVIDLNGTIRELTKTTKQQSSDAQQRITELEQEITKLKSTNPGTGTSQELIDAKQRIIELEQEIATLKSANPGTGTTQELNDAKLKITQLEQEINNKNSEISSLQASDKGAELSKLTKELNDAKQRITQLQNEITSLQSANPGSGTSQQLNDAKQRITELDQRIYEKNLEIWDREKNSQYNQSLIKKLLIGIGVLLLIIAVMGYVIYTNKTDNTIEPDATPKMNKNNLDIYDEDI